MSKSENKVAQRYRQMIVDAFFALCHRYSYDEITILMIAQEADVSRQTFYRHFKTKDDIIHYYLGSLSAGLSHHLQSQPEISVRHLLLAYFHFWQDNVSVLNLVYSGHIEHLLIRQYNELMMKELDILRPFYPHISDRQFTLFKSFLIGGLYQIKYEWYLRNYKETPEEMVDLLALFLEMKA